MSQFFFCIMGVFISLSVIQLFHQSGRRISKNQRHRLRLLIFHICFTGFTGFKQRVGFRRHPSGKLRLVHNLPDFLDTAGHCTEINKLGLCPSRIMLARVVFPTPGGPQKIMEEIWSFSISCRRIFPFPSRCSWPAKSSRESGRSLVARGADCPLSSNNDICSISYTSLFPYPDERFSFLEAGESCLLL